MTVTIVRLFCLLACASLSVAASVISGWSFTPFVSTTVGPLRLPLGQAWDAQGSYYLNEGSSSSTTSTLYKFKKSALPFSGPLTPSSSALEYARTFPSTNNASGLAFHNNKLYLSQPDANRIIEINPATGATVRTVVSQPYPLDLKVDPISGDLFFSSLAFGSQGGIYRIKNIESASPQHAKYALTNGVDGFSFAADGTIFASLYYDNVVAKVTRVNDVAQPFINFGSLPKPDGSAVGVCNGEEVLVQVSADNKAVYMYNLNTRVRTNLVTASSKLDLAYVGPDNAFYISQHNNPDSPQVLVNRLYNPDCVFTQPPSPGPTNSTCGANCQAKTVSASCSLSSASSTGTCITLSFSSTVQTC